VREVMNLMAEYGPLVRYRIAPAHGTILIGSKSRNIPSELHTLTLSYRISSPRQLRLKRALDVGLSIFLIPLAPAVLILVRAPWQFLNNWWQVLSGHLSWVTYARPHGGRLPGIRAGILNPTMRYDVDFHSDTAARQINSLYAMDYSIWTDLVIFFKNLKALDRQPQ
jgi:hypothetical protein